MWLNNGTFATPNDFLPAVITYDLGSAVHLTSVHIWNYNEVNLVKLQKAMMVADKIGVDIDQLFEWAKPTSKYWVCHKIAEDIRKTLRAR